MCIEQITDAAIVRRFFLNHPSRCFNALVTAFGASNFFFSVSICDTYQKDTYSRIVQVLVRITC